MMADIPPATNAQMRQWGVECRRWRPSTSEERRVLALIERVKQEEATVERYGEALVEISEVADPTVKGILDTGSLWFATGWNAAAKIARAALELKGGLAGD